MAPTERGAAPLPLEDLRILAVEQYGAGPWGSLQLSDLGAEVIKVEDPTVGGDIGRYVPPFREGTDSLFFETFNRGKQSISLDLRHPDARAVLHDVVREVDAVYSNLRGDQPRKLGLTYDELRHVNPRIVCCSLSGYGQTGPLAGVGAYDYVIQGRAGWMSVTGEPGGNPMKSGLSLVDYCGGYIGAIALLAGVWRARRDGVGCDCDVTLMETALSLLTYLGTWVASTGYEPRRTRDSAHPSIVPFQNFQTADGWIVVACAKDKFWQALCVAIEQPELADDPRYAGLAERDAHREPLLATLREVFARRTTSAWLATLADAGVPSAPVNDVRSALTDPYVAARDALAEYEHPRLGRVRQVRTPLRVGDRQREVARAPFPGEHTQQVLAELCAYDADRIAQLESAGAFGSVAERA